MPSTEQRIDALIEVIVIWAAWVAGGVHVIFALLIMEALFGRGENIGGDGMFMFAVWGAVLATLIAPLMILGLAKAFLRLRAAWLTGSAGLQTD